MVTHKSLADSAGEFSISNFQFSNGEKVLASAVGSGVSGGGVFFGGEVDV